MTHAITESTEFQTLDLGQLDAVTGGIDWGKVWNSGVQDAGTYGVVGTGVGAAMGSVAPGIGTMAGAGAGATIGTGVGFAWGAGRELYSQWTGGGQQQPAAPAAQ